MLDLPVAPAHPRRTDLGGGREVESLLSAEMRNTADEVVKENPRRRSYPKLRHNHISWSAIALLASRTTPAPSSNPGVLSYPRSLGEEGRLLEEGCGPSRRHVSTVPAWPTGFARSFSTFSCRA